MQAEFNTGVCPITPEAVMGRFPAIYHQALIPELEDCSIGSSRYRLFLAALEMVDLESLDINCRCDTGRLVRKDLSP
ncbi:MAG: hypothetical protein OXB95_10495 [Rhodobacteraceae bacterium]|nr:hypothetical protein [Paracoccaceae bacterium]